MAEPIDVPNPYNHASLAKKLEGQNNIRDAETEYRLAMKAADNLPLADYRNDFIEALSGGAGEVFSDEDVKQLVNAYRELLSLPFLTRVQLSGFYARNGAVPEALEILEEALSIGIDPLLDDDGELKSIFRRAREFHRDLSDIVGPDNVESLFLKHFDRLDTNKDGFVDQEELRRAQLDIGLDGQAQEMIRYLMYHYFDVEVASNDEFGMEISGLTKADVRNFQKLARARWKRMKKMK